MKHHMKHTHFRKKARRYKGYTAAVLAELWRGGVGIFPTDTLYGIVAPAFSEAAVERIYRLRKRSKKKPSIILIAAPEDIALFGIKAGRKERLFLEKAWPGKVSVILSCPGSEFSYLHRGAYTLAFRVPKNAALRRFLKFSGPLIAPSANPEGKPPAQTIREARRYFGDRVDFYIHRGRLGGKPSRLVELKNGEVKILRK